MNVELELAYLGVEVADPTAFGTPRRRRRPRPRRHHDRRRPDLAQRRPRQRIIVQEGRPTTPSSSASRPCQPSARPGCRAPRGATRSTVTDGTAADLAARRVERLVRIEAPWGVPVEIVHGLATAGDAFASPRPGRVPHEGPGVRSRGVPHHRPRRRRPLRPRGDRPRAVGLDGDRPRRYPADGPLLPLQPAPPLARHRLSADRARRSCTT